jgi:hypothetical protein
VPTINLADDELAAAIAAIRRAIEDDRFPHAPRLDPLRAALEKFDAAPEPTALPKAAPPAKADKRAAIKGGPGAALSHSPEVPRRVPPVRFTLKC